MSGDAEGTRITYRLATTDDFPALVALKGKMKGETRAPAEWIARWPWQFVEHPGRRPGDSANMVLALLDGVIAGAIGILPVRLRYRGQVIDAAYGCELFVDPDTQGHGIGQKLILEVVARYPESLWVNTPPAGARSYAKRGFDGVEPVPFFMLPVHPGHILSSRGKPALGRLLSWSGGLGRMWARMRAGSHRLPAGIFLAEVSRFDEEFTAFQASLDDPEIVRPVRDAAYLEWRYRKCPFGPYRVKAARARDELAGFVVYRVKPSPHGRMGTINELEASPRIPGLREALLSAAVRDLLDEKPDLIVGVPTAPAQREAFRVAGFLDTGRSPYLYIAPGAAARLGLPLDGAQWSMSMGDSDVDYF